MTKENEMLMNVPVAQRNPGTRIFLGPHGLRGGWRVLIFFTLLVAIVLGCIRLVHLLGVRQRSGVILPGISLVGEILLLLSVMIATAII